MYAYLKTPKLYGMGNIKTEEVMEKLDIFQARFGKVDELGWWYMDIIQTDSGTKFTSKELQKGIPLCELRLALAAPDHQ